MEWVLKRPENHEGVFASISLRTDATREVRWRSHPEADSIICHKDLLTLFQGAQFSAE
jgi:hypothetical protein